MKRISALAAGIALIALAAVHPSRTADKAPEAPASVRLAESMGRRSL